MIDLLKTTGKILVILLMAVIVATGIYFTVQNASSSATTSVDNQNFNNTQQFRSEGGDSGPAEGFIGIFGTLLKISTIVALVFFAQNLIANAKRKPFPASTV
jgi:hypothetical protein